MNVAIIGAGPSGLAAAYELAVRGIKVDIYEKDAHVGGLARTLNILGEPVELGPHFVVNHEKTEAEKDFFAFFEENALPYDRRSRICLDGVYFDYPPRVLDILKKWGVGRSAFAFLSLLKHRYVVPSGPPNAYTYVRKALGQTVCDAFFKAYTEKLWGVPCDQLDESYARSLIGFEKLSLANLLTKLRSTGNADFHQACLYPQGGLGVIWARLKEAIEAHGGRFHMQAAISSFALRGNRVSGLVMADGRECACDMVLSSVPDALMLRMLPGVPAPLLDSLKNVRARKVALLYLKVKNADVVPDNTVFLHGVSVRAVRATNFNRFKSVSGAGVILLEYWLSPTDVWCRDSEALIPVGLEDLGRAFGVDKADVLGAHVEYVNAAYLVPDPGLASIRAAVRAHLDGYEGLYRMGRGNQDLFNYGVVQAAQDGLATAQRLAGMWQEGLQSAA